MRLFRSFPNSNIPSHDHAALSRSALMMSRASYGRIKAGDVTVVTRKAERVNRRRSGQALLLAVLLMVFAALLGSTFITVVSLNLNQTARQGNLSSARSSANSGIEWVRTNIVNSEKGTQWRPEMLAPPPVPTDPTYNFYYTSFERAQGWARTVPKASRADNITGVVVNGNWDKSTEMPDPFDDIKDDWAKLEYYRRNPNTAVGTSGYSKVPDPRSPQGPAVLSNPGNASGNANAPVYLAQVKYLMPAPPSAPLTNNDDPAKSGLLELSVIGLSEDNPSVFDRRIAYMQSTAQSPLTAAMRVVTNWDFANNTVPEGRVGDGGVAVGASTIRLEFSSGQPLSFPFYIAIGGPVGQVVNAVPTNTLQTVLITGQTTTPNVYTLGQPVPAGQSIPQNARFQVAAALGSPPAIDYDSDGNPNTATEAAALMVSQNGMPGRIKINGSMAFFGNPIAANLDSTQSLVNISASGLISNHNIFGASPRLFNANAGAGAFNGTISQSSDATFPFVSPDASAPTSPTEKAKLVNDGYNALTGNVSDPTRQVRPFTPPTVAVDDATVDRYRQLTKFSESLISGATTGSMYGYGEGIYINNPQDKERVNSGVAGQYREMSQSELQDLWLSGDNTGAQYRRRVIASTPALPSKSLEEKHLRGWVSPEEFQARGTLIELDPAGKAVTITLDTRNDTGTTLLPLFPPKGWSKADGTLDGHPTEGGVYRKTLPWPANGVIFAEGNLRVRGGAFLANGDPDLSPDPERSITIVSMNNIYIEGSVNAGRRKVLLLAKKNVVLNPTRVIGHVEAQTLVSSTTLGTPATDTIPVYNASLFTAGDWIRISANLRRQIRSVDAVNNTLRLTENLPTSGNYPAGTTSLRTENDPKFNSDPGNAPYSDYATRIKLFGDVLQRRFNLPGGATQLRMAFRHNAERREVIGITVEDTDPMNITLDKALLVNKVAANQQTSIIKSPEKFLRIDYNTVASTTGSHRFPNTAPTAENSVTAPYGAKNYTLFPVDPAVPVPNADLQTDLGLPQTGATWRYPASRQGDYTLTVPAPPPSPAPPPPSFFLAALGNRPDLYPADFAVPATEKATTFPFGLNLRPTTVEKKIPVATSVVLNTNIAQAVLSNDIVGETVRQFGFSFLHGAGLPAATEPTSWEDALTVDQSFYRSGPETLTPSAPQPTTPEHDNTYFVLDSRTITPSLSTGNFVTGPNSLSLQFDQRADGYFRATSTATVKAAPIPAYRLSRMKLEKIIATATPDNTPEFVEPAVKLNVNAFVYAQEGSWMVIPGTFFDDKVKSNPTGDAFIDYNNDGTQGVTEATTTGTITGPDLNRDGVVTRAEQVAAYRFKRYNYQINFTGAIMERQSATIMTETTGVTGAVVTVGAVQEAMDKWATVNLGAGNFSAGSLNKTTVRSNQNNTDPTVAGALRNITYTFDDDISNANDPAVYALFNQDSGLQVPASPDLIYTG